MRNIELTLLKWAPVKIVLDFAKRRVLPGSGGLSLYEVGRFFAQAIHNGKLEERAAAVTYFFLLAIPPTLLFLFSLVPYLPLADAQQTILDTINLITPKSDVRESLTAFVTDFMNKERKEILSLGILLTIYFSSNGMMGLMGSFDTSVPVYVKRSKLRRRWVALKLTLMLICVALISLVVFIIQTRAVNDLLLELFNSVTVVKLLSLIIVVAIIFCSISIIYIYGPSLTHRFNFVSPGSVLATVLSVITTVVFFFLVNNFINYSKVYGSIGTLIAFMVWIWLNTLVILLGYELNVSILLGKSHAAEAKKELVA